MEAVHHPAHYGGDTPHETVKCLEAWGLEADALLWNAVKYISRAGKKGAALEDLRKAQWYLSRRIQILEERSNPMSEETNIPETEAADSGPDTVQEQATDTPAETPAE